MNIRTEIKLDADTQKRAEARAAELGLSLEAYVRKLVANDLGAESAGQGDISRIFNLIEDGPETDIARDKDRMLSEAVWQEYLEETGRRPDRE